MSSCWQELKVVQLIFEQVLHPKSPPSPLDKGTAENYEITFVSKICPCCVDKSDCFVIKKHLIVVMHGNITSLVWRWTEVSSIWQIRKLFWSILYIIWTLAIFMWARLVDWILTKQCKSSLVRVATCNSCTSTGAFFETCIPYADDLLDFICRY